MNMREISLALLVVAACHVSADVPTSTPCSLSFYRYLFNLPGEKIRPNVPEGTYVFGKRVGPIEGQASDFQPAVVKPAPSYEAPEYLPPPKPTTTTTTTTTPKPTTSAPTYIPPPPPSPVYYPAEASNTIAVIQPAKPACEHPEHQQQQINALLPPYRFEPPTQPKYQPQPTFVIPKFAPLPVPQKPVFVNNNEILAAQQKQQVFRFPVPTPPPQFLRPYSQPAAKDCDKHNPVPIVIPIPSTTAAPSTPEPYATTDSLVETRQNEIVIVPAASEPPHSADCGHESVKTNVIVESLGVPSTDYGVVSAPAPAPSAGYSYDRPNQPLLYPASSAGYNYPKPSPSFEYPSGYAGLGTSLFESESPKTSAGSTEDGDLVILKV